MKRVLRWSTPSAKRGLTFKLAGLLILLAGLGSSVFVWLAQDRIDRQERKQGVADMAAAPLEPDDSRLYTHDMELYYGQSGLLVDKWRRWFEGLARGKSLAKTIAVLSLAAGGGCFLMAKGPKTRR
jgi:hypothetical protein